MDEIKKPGRGGRRAGAGRPRKDPSAPRKVTAKEKRQKIAGKPLPNPKHERYAQSLADGKPQGKSYEEAGYTGNDGAASRLANDARIKERIAELQQRRVADLVAKNDAARQYVLDVISETIERCRQVCPVLDRKGNIVMVETPSGEMAPAFTFDAKNALRGAELLGKELGMLIDRTENTHVIRDISDTPPTAEQWAEQYATAH